MVSGRVQGVWFRESCRTEALAQGVTGWVRNLPDGAVEAVFEGPEDAVARMVRWARTGPPTARVQDVQVQEDTAVAASERLYGFEVRPTPRDG
ncbi:acylphosphatase [Streptomyces sp. WAC06614]|nr:acylphosphatase [Streptomyces sp. WAC06614]